MIRSEHLQLLAMLVPTLLIVLALSITMSTQAVPQTTSSVTGGLSLEEVVVVDTEIGPLFTVVVVR